MSIQLAVLDMAGTTVRDNLAVATAFQQAFLQNGFTISLEDAHLYMGVKKVVAIQKMLQQLDVPIEDSIIRNIHDDFVCSMLQYYTSDPAVQPFDDTEKVLQAIRKKGIRVALNTGFPFVIAQAIVKRWEWLERGVIDDFIASDQVQEGRPSAQMIQQLMQRGNLSSPDSVIKVGDTVVDIAEGQQAGCKFVIAVTTGSGKYEELKNANPTHIIHSLTELHAILEL